MPGYEIVCPSVIKRAGYYHAKLTIKRLDGGLHLVPLYSRTSPVAYLTRKDARDAARAWQRETLELNPGL